MTSIMELGVSRCVVLWSVTLANRQCIHFCLSPTLHSISNATCSTLDLLRIPRNSLCTLSVFVSSVGKCIELSSSPSCALKYAAKAGLNVFLDKLGFNLVGYGCTTCIGNSGPLPEEIVQAIDKENIYTRNVWEADPETPIFSKDKDYLKELMPNTEK